MTGDPSFPEGTPGIDPRVPDARRDRGSRILGTGSGGRSIAIAVVSTVVVFGGLVLLIGNSPGWPSIHESFFDGEVFAYSFGRILRAFGLNVVMFTVAEAFVLVFAMVIAILRSLPGAVFLPLRVLAAVY